MATHLDIMYTAKSITNNTWESGHFQLENHIMCFAHTVFPKANPIAGGWLSMILNEIQ